MTNLIEVVSVPVLERSGNPDSSGWQKKMKKRPFSAKNAGLLYGCAFQALYIVAM